MSTVLWIGFILASALVGKEAGLIFSLSCLIVWKFKKYIDQNKETYEVTSHKVSPAITSADSKQPGAKDNYKNIRDWESDLTTVWAGEYEIEFTYEKRDSSRSRRKIKLREVCFDRKSRIYLKGFDHGRDEQRTFNIDNITTKILLKSKRYDVDDFLEEVLGLDVSLMELSYSR